MYVENTNDEKENKLEIEGVYKQQTQNHKTSKY